MHCCFNLITVLRFCRKIKFSELSRLRISSSSLVASQYLCSLLDVLINFHLDSVKRNVFRYSSYKALLRIIFERTFESSHRSRNVNSKQRHLNCTTYCTVNREISVSWKCQNFVVDYLNVQNLEAGTLRFEVTRNIIR